MVRVALRAAVRDGHHQPLADHRGGAATAPSRRQHRGQPAVPAQRRRAHCPNRRPVGSSAAPHSSTALSSDAVVLSGDGEILGHRPPFRVAGLTRIMPQLGRHRPGAPAPGRSRSAVAVRLAFGSCLSVPLPPAGRATSPRVPAPSAPARAASGELLLQVALRGGRGHQPRGADRRRPRRLLLDGVLQGPRRRRLHADLGGDHRQGAPRQDRRRHRPSPGSTWRPSVDVPGIDEAEFQSSPRPPRRTARSPGCSPPAPRSPSTARLAS